MPGAMRMGEEKKEEEEEEEGRSREKVQVQVQVQVQGSGGSALFWCSSGEVQYGEQYQGVHCILDTYISVLREDCPTAGIIQGGEQERACKLSSAAAAELCWAGRLQ
ncbi:hypothetical protein HYE67_005885 [Fusarium culmorum]|uniref:Uncharacterized protein n=1 Tax=Fusarium culmorum TaxID=5516 RepID=A0A2T4GCT5_FUSCU|nr:hypothetical protein FCULG_00010342 [Fusarium culmorum]QPC63654.1 hypothetical protein HYE67_005885 [Fusarium culmorum]